MDIRESRVTDALAIKCTPRTVAVDRHPFDLTTVDVAGATSDVDSTGTRRGFHGRVTDPRAQNLYVDAIIRDILPPL